MSSPTLKILPALMIAITAALVTQPMRAGAIDTLVITELSSTSLTALLTTPSGTTSLTVTPDPFAAADIWFIALLGISPQSGTFAAARRNSKQVNKPIISTIWSHGQEGCSIQKRSKRR